ncbi:ATP synthase F1 subunit delta [Apilactobacillus timberlakei]|uniref:ATP synthase subunit delta n=1 Tax=Apilactobacillus timberlakei TaxID=2008380 RepID=A0ABY2YS34_9LACO|nr:ATP synthase F1 subunit delta [Apilactobacillus timberlakei]TPR12641.1 F0F1 ATP synthase subunit delta [Apilactobacillus timberlakei]TPR13470.1 F0F1 ATP synthase subunit delta [Apilactobacillus timberlakei]TPR15543.1 F0F1 ATP synthase subunit delta [Apilactobacillus timberlakei]TPR17791.1 F0F1 ATP synthase subunit delta [Apilactobacillus timberlakei]TPR18492.1 F0F1 ATP synthase subunit delta [Apilactobacillus timberlakei]
MLDKITFAKRYSKVIFELLDSNNQVEDGYNELLQIKQVFENNSDLGNSLTDVSFPEEYKNNLAKPLIENVDIDVIKNLLNVLLSTNNMDEITMIVDEFEQLYDEKNKIVRAVAITAVPLSDEQTAKLSDTFKARMNAKKVILNNKIDQSIIGGVVIKSSNVIFDGSVSTKISSIKKLLLN